MMTVIEAVDAYVDAALKSELSNRTNRYHASAIRSSSLAGMSLRSLKRLDIERYCTSRLTSVSFATVDGELRLLRRAIEHASRNRRMEMKRNPAMGINLPRKPATSVKITNEQLQALYDALDARPKVRALVELAVETKMRRGELLGLLWDDLDLDAGLANLRGTKAHKPRTVPLSERAVTILSDLERPHYRVFHMSIEKLRWAMESAGRKAGLQGVRFDDLRHCAARASKD